MCLCVQACHVDTSLCRSFVASPFIVLSRDLINLGPLALFSSPHNVVHSLDNHFQVFQTFESDFHIPLSQEKVATLGKILRIFQTCSSLE